MKIAIVEPLLSDYVGHYFSLVSRLKSGFQTICSECKVDIIAADWSELSKKF